jgi:hypothetical protein
MRETPTGTMWHFSVPSEVKNFGAQTFQKTNWARKATQLGETAQNQETYKQGEKHRNLSSQLMKHPIS